MEKIGKNFTERKSYQSWIYIGIIVLTTIIMALLWKVCLPDNNNDVIQYLSSVFNFLFFLTLLIGMIVLFFKIYTKESEKNERMHEFNRKINWEEFQYKLNKAERVEKIYYDRIDALLDKIKNKEIVDNNTLNERVKQLESDLKEWKLNKDKQLFVEINHLNNDKNNNPNKL